MTTAIERLRAFVEASHEASSFMLARETVCDAITESDAWKREAADWRASADRLRADRDRLAARVAELEQWGRDRQQEWQQVNDALTDEREAALRRVAELEGAALVAESAQREADLQSLVGRARDVPADREAQGRAWAASCVTGDGRWAREAEADADPCPVDAETLGRWATGGALGVEAMDGDYAVDHDDGREMARGLAWLLTRRAAAMREGR